MKQIAHLTILTTTFTVQDWWVFQYMYYMKGINCTWIMNASSKSINVSWLLVTCDKKNINLRSYVSIQVHSAYPFRHFRVLELFVLSLLRKKIIIHFFNYWRVNLYIYFSMKWIIDLCDSWRENLLYISKC